VVPGSGLRRGGSGQVQAAAARIRFASRKRALRHRLALASRPAPPGRVVVQTGNVRVVVSPDNRKTVIGSALRALLALAAQIGFPPTRPVADEPAAAVVSAGRGAPMPHADRSQVGVRRAVRPASVTADQRPLPRPATGSETPHRCQPGLRTGLR
jgi:hypothetical protein